jgi:hypothetical protein
LLGLEGPAGEPTNGWEMARVLVVGDEAASHTLATAILEEQHQVYSAKNGVGFARARGGYEWGGHEPGTRARRIRSWLGC